jgi:CDP-diglyceride synthetase
VGCLLALAVLAIPRTIMVVLWIFSDYLAQAYGTWVWPLLGFFFLPTTTLGYAVAQNRYDGVEGWGLVLVILGVLVDLGAIGGGRGLGKRRTQRREL